MAGRAHPCATPWCRPCACPSLSLCLVGPAHGAALSPAHMGVRGCWSSFVGVLRAAGRALRGLAAPPAAAAERPVKIVALGDSLTAGFGLPANAAFPAKLERALERQGPCGRRSPMPGSPATPPPAGSPGSTGRCRRAPTPSSSSLAPTTCCAGSTRRSRRKALEAIVRRLGERRIPVLLAGMRAAPNLGRRLRPRLRGDLPGARRQIRRAALSVLPRRRRRRCRAQPARRPASHRRRRRRDRRRHPAQGRGTARARAREAHDAPAMPNRCDCIRALMVV